MKKTYYYGTGKRKSAIARVFMCAGSGVITVNNKNLEQYFPSLPARIMVTQPLKITNYLGNFDVKVTVRGSGFMGQAGAVRHGITRALLDYAKKEDKEDMAIGLTTEVDSLQSEEDAGTLTIRRTLRRAKLVTRDARRVERKKVGLRKARKCEQYSKR